MKKFSFRLDRVLRWREQQAEVEEERLHLLLAELAGIQDELARWEQDKRAVETALVSFSSAEAHQLATLDHWRQHLSRLRLRIDTRMADCRKRIAQQQQAVLEGIYRQGKSYQAVSDDTGILQHATFNVPRYDEGYCLDDNARALLLMALLEEAGTEEARGVRALSARYLAFVNHAFNERRGRFRNFMSYSREWLEEYGAEDAEPARLAHRGHHWLQLGWLHHGRSSGERLARRRSALRPCPAQAGNCQSEVFIKWLTVVYTGDRFRKSHSEIHARGARRVRIRAGNGQDDRISQVDKPCVGSRSGIDIAGVIRCADIKGMRANT